MNDDIYLSALSGLLHDIGKLMLRAGTGGSRIWDDEAEQDFKYKHAMLSADCVDLFVPERWRVQVKNAVANHHRPQHATERIVTLADHLSAGERDDEFESGAGASPYQQLLSIFCSVKADDQSIPDTAYLPIAALELGRETIFPGRAMPKDVVQDAYLRLWDALIEDGKWLKNAYEQEGDLGTYLESLALLLQRYTWCIPSAYWKTRPDVSLYDHGRMTAALAAVFAGSDFEDAMLQALISNPETDEPLALLVGGDISGVQDFIYTITSRGAASALRGRSFYMQLLTEAIARFVLRSLELPITNLIYQGGGKFYILARPDDAGRLPQIQRFVSQVLLQQHRGELFAALAGVELKGRDFFDGRISQSWDEVNQSMQLVKQRRFAELDAADLVRLFEAQGDGGNEDKQCHVCGAEHPDTVKEKRTEDSVVHKCPTCQSYEALGKDLRKAQILSLEEITAVAPDIHDSPGEYADALACFGMKAQVVEDLQDLSQHTGERQVLLALKDAALADLAPGSNTAIGRRFLVNVTPVLSEDEYFEFKDKVDDLPHHRQDGSWPDPVKSFSVLEKQSQGIKRLGVLRVDVDDLGRLFSEGLGDRATLSRVAALSFAISLYFDGWVEKVAEEVCGDQIYSIYSGGDDLFFVGSWELIVEFARQVRADLTPYAANHPGIHASAGVVLVGGKYPLAQAARDAGRAESLAKSYRYGERTKDAISFLGQVQPWEQFGLGPCEPGDKTVHQLMHLLVDMTDTREGTRKAAPKSLLGNLSRLYAQYADAEQERQETGEDVRADGQPQVLWGPWMWRGYYMLRRMGKRTGLHDIDTLAERLHDEEFRNMNWIGLAARWAELLNRSDSSKR